MLFPSLAPWGLLLPSLSEGRAGRLAVSVHRGHSPARPLPSVWRLPEQEPGGQLELVKDRKAPQRPHPEGGSGATASPEVWQSRQVTCRSGKSYNMQRTMGMPPAMGRQGRRCCRGPESQPGW